MFGHDKTDDKAEPETVAPSTSDDATDDTAAPEPQEELTLPSPTTDTPADTDSTPPAGPPPAFDAAATDTPAPAADASDTSTAPAAPEPTPDAELSSTTIGISGNGALSNLSSLKQEALRELSPLIGQLDQTPDEKYATAKMVYEETKDQNLLKDVYEAAKNLPDEKARAEAIYDIVKKINELK